MLGEACEPLEVFDVCLPQQPASQQSPRSAGDPLESLQPEGSVSGQLHQQGDHHQQDATGELGNLPRHHGPRWQGAIH